MSGGRFPVKPPSSNNFFSKADKLADHLNIALRDGVDTIALVITAKTGSFPRTHPKLLKEDLVKIVGDSNVIDNIKLSRNGKLYITTKQCQAAQKLLSTKTILGLEVDPFIQLETITSKFLLHNIDQSVTCFDIAEELEGQGLPILEARRFVRKSAEGEIPTQTVLITIIGTSLPTEVKLWYEVFRVSLFYDRPRQCSNCFKYNHSTASCRSQKICSRCAESHDGECKAESEKCYNCKKAHDAKDKSCPAYSNELQLQKYKSENRLTISEARRRFSDYQNLSKKSFATVVSSPPPEVATKADLESALSNLTAQFSSMVQAMVAELHQSMQTMVASVVQPIMGIIQDLQVKLSQKSSLANISDLLQQKSSKKICLRKDSSSDMDAQSCPPSVPRVILASGNPPPGGS